MRLSVMRRSASSSCRNPLSMVRAEINRKAGRSAGASVSGTMLATATK
jgi:hypothetical protein